ncbi:inositol monophosphatase [Thermus scotoductus]|uniref:Inositol-1-monophosphatase n=1 Tax=Thermus scotoductus TaxID=37636 RepID=A0A430S8B6_THESC|nr:inositol monophosphatase family protein [Thermus scotoductus]RTG94139.1 inositol monophosphatase [Thermus scotoductus]RTH08332.1 inositol monophosphatase [Thermus scotoductus]RTH08433.1 inositol monophosphatase [Thermus scotoductus]RTH12645.1 inositol monophosphatase [Thermus scotoductus]RTH14811.1 inositol monophosphatase [Thermus scotoductus]
MIGRKHPYFPYLEAMLEAAHLAKGIHAYYQAKGFTHGTKSGPTDLVTQADRESEEAIKELLLSRFPEAGFLGEEGGSEGGKALRFIVDPLDGTVNYAHGFPFYGVSLALEVEGKVQVGVVLDTSRDEAFYAVRGEGAFLNGRPIRVTERKELLGSLLATGFPYDVAKDPENLTYFHRALSRGLLVRRPGAAALDLVYVAAGRLEGFWEVKLNPWDVAAGWLIVEEAGGKVTDLEGRPYRLGHRYIVATNGHIHEALIQTLLAQG